MVIHQSYLCTKMTQMVIHRSYSSNDKGNTRKNSYRIHNVGRLTFSYKHFFIKQLQKQLHKKVAALGDLEDEKADALLYLSFRLCFVLLNQWDMKFEANHVAESVHFCSYYNRWYEQIFWAFYDYHRKAKKNI